jgi:hypothetical protein
MRPFCGIVAAGMAAAGTFAAAVAVAADADLERLAQARALWAAADHDAYVYAYERYCECYRNEQPQTVVTVSDGRIERVFHLHENSEREVPAPERGLDLYSTIDDLFAKIARAFDLEATVRVSYDESLGYPVALYIDYDPSLVGDETDIRLLRLEPL